MSGDGQSAERAQWLQALALADTLLGQEGALLAYDRECRYVYWSEGMERISGFAAAEVIGRSVFVVFPFLIATGEDAHLRAALDGESRVSRDRTFWIPETGREGTYDARYVPLRAGDGTILGGVAIVRDVSERMRVEAQVRETEQRFRTMADASPVLLWMARTDGMCTFFNQTWVDFTGRTQDEEWGVGWAEGVHFEDLQRCLDTYVDAFNQRRVFEMEYRLRRADGEFRWVLDRGTPRYLPDGSFAGYIGSCIDITDRKHAEIELRRNMHAKDEFLGLVSHELRTPVTALQLQIERLRRHGTTFSQREHEIVARIGATTERLVHMIESVLQVCRIDSGKLRLEVTEFDLRGVIAALVDELRPTAEKKGLQLGFRALGELPALRSDAEIVRMIVSNLVANAIKFTDTGTVDVILQHDGSAHRICVRDTGCGIPPDQYARIFGVFERLEPTKNKHTPGVGLGLSLVKALIGTLGGTIGVESELGRGSAFTVVVPPAR